MKPETNTDIYEFFKTTKITSYFYRSKIVILNLEGMSNEQIAKHIGLSKVTVRKWIARYNKKGISGLMEGRK